MPTFRSHRFSVRARVLLLVLGLALPPLVLVSMLGLSSLDRARDTAVQVGTEALRSQAEANLAEGAADKARLYDAQLASVRQQVESVAAYTAALVDSGAPAPADGRVWVSPDGPTSPQARTYAGQVELARRFVPLLQSAAQRNPLVSLGYVALDEGGVIAFDKDIIDILTAIRPFDPRQRVWYVNARDAGRTVWANTYVDANTKKLTTTCATPIYDAQENFIGVVGFDVLLDTIQQDVLDTDLGGAGSAFLINDRGEVLVRNDMTAAGRRWDERMTTENLLRHRDARMRAVAERMVRAEQGVDRLRLGDEEVYLAFAPIESAGWSVGIVIPVSEIVGPAQTVGATIAERQSLLSAQLAIVLTVTPLVVLAVGVLLSLLLTRPLRELQSGAQRVAAGDLSYRVPDAGSDEVGEVGRAFNAMTGALREKVRELEENLRQLSALNAVSNRFRQILAVHEQLDAIPRGACECFGFERAALYLIEGQTLRAVSAYFGPGAAEQEALWIEAANGSPLLLDSPTVEADVVRSGQAVIVDNPWDNPRVVQAKQQITRSDAYVQVPIFGREEQVIGLLSADYYFSRRVPTARDAAQLLTYASMAGLTIENTRLYHSLEQQVARRTDELRGALARAQEADRLKGQFLAAVSHELRTPLNAIIGFSTVLLDEIDGSITPLQAEDLKIINRNGRFLLHLINELLDLARIESGRIELQPEAVDVRTLVQEVAETVQGLLHNRKVTLHLALPERLPRVRADTAKARQVLLNLLANAVKFTEQGSITIAAQCVVMPGLNAGEENGQPFIVRNGRRLTPYVAISVRDTGIGIAPDDLPLIFEEFHQVSGGQAGRRGSGLGLAISRRLIEAMSGRIWAESSVGQGSVFTFTLPCHVEVPRQLQPAEPQEVAV